MQDELNANYPQLDIQLLAIDRIDAQGNGVSNFSIDQDLPMVVDNNSDSIWSTWGGAWRDVVILNQDNEIVTSYNLTQYNLANQSNYDTLKQLLIDTATQ